MLNKRWVRVVGLLLVGALLLTGCSEALRAGGAAVAAAGASDQPEVRKLSVRGTGRAMGTPDVAYVTLGVESRDVDASAAVSDNTERMQRVMEVLEEFGIDDKDIRTVQFSMWLAQEPEAKPEIREEDGTAERFRVLNQVRITLRDLDAVGDLLGAALEAGANSVAGIQFAIEDPEALRERARQEAIANAIAKAEQLAAGFDAAIHRVHSISEFGGGGPEMPAMVREVYGLGAAGGGVPVSGGELTVTVEVQVTFELAD